MKTFLNGLILMFVVALASCDTGSHSTAIDVSTETEKIMQLESEWSEMFGARDLDGIMTLVAQDSVLIMPGSEPVVGAEDIRRATRMMLESGDEVSWKSDFASVAPSGDMAYDYGMATTRLADGSEVEGYYLVVWVKEEGRWKIAADMFN
ncbi:MAG: nuclear transport factor 2 family protein [Proteobacteria bacterium]|nr:nuclear transport factor 2 family protein [Pseudomonadota bacterium]